MLDIDAITVRYGRVAAIRDVSLTVESGTVHGIIGPNGAGKSTLMDAVCGRRSCSSGRIRFDGHDVTRESVARRRRRGLARSFQRTNIFPGLTVREQLELVASRFRGATIDEVVDAFDLGPLLPHRGGVIAYGDQRRVDIGLAVVASARCVLLDEPAAGLTADETTSVFEHLVALVRDRGMTALLVEHDVDAVFGFCDTVTVLDLGAVLATGAPAAVRSDPAVVAAYLGSAA